MMSTERYAMAVRLKNEKKDFYLKNHQNVWPEVLEELKKIKIKNYSIFLKEDFMFGYLEYEGDNFNKDMSQMRKIDIVDKWTKLMVDCFNPFPNNEDNDSWVMMDKIFYME
jgi:L-rhamnose mutarotase